MFPIFNRFTRTRAAEASSPRFPGVWQVIDRNGSAILNGVPLGYNSILLPDQQGNIVAHAGGELAVRQERLAHFIPDESEREGFASVARRLGPNPAWEHWFLVSPLRTDEANDDSLAEHLIKAIRQGLPDLQSVFDNPWTHLRHEEFPVAVSRARRVAGRAPEYLAAHSEDWGIRRRDSVEPSRILSVRIEEELAIYENRVAVRLTDLIDQSLGRLIRRVRNRLAMQAAAEDKSRYRSARFRWQRAFTLYGEAFLSGGRSLIDAWAEDTDQLEVLLELLRKVRRLTNSVLYRALPKSVDIPTSLQPTNLFTNHPHYAGVAALWREVTRSVGNRISNLQYQDGLQKSEAQFVKFCQLLCYRALQQLGFAPIESTEDSTTQKSLDLLRERDFETVRVSTDAYGFLTIDSPETSEYRALRIAPLFACLDALQKGTADEAMLSALLEDIKAAGHCVLVLYPPSGAELADVRLQSIGNGESTPIDCGFLPVSAWELTSVEKVSRAINWHILNRKYRNYPPEIDGVPRDIGDRLKKMHEHFRIIPKREGAFHLIEPGSVTVVNREIEDLKRRSKAKPYSGAGKDLNAIERFRTRLEACEADLDRLRVCPVCKEQVIAPLSPRENGAYECLCERCNSSWGLNRCADCGKLYPFLGVMMPEDARPSLVGWVDDILGRDVLATPCWMERTGKRYICPDCGTCPNSKHEMGRTCARCKSGSNVPLE